VKSGIKGPGTRPNDSRESTRTYKKEKVLRDCKRVLVSLNIDHVYASLSKDGLVYGDAKGCSRRG